MDNAYWDKAKSLIIEARQKYPDEKLYNKLQIEYN